MTVIVIVCPGQGSQKPGFLAPWIENESYRAQLAAYSDATAVNLIKHGTTSDADTIRDTAVAQPLIVAAGLLTLRALDEAGVLLRVSGIPGHSVGEITAAAGAGVFDEITAMTFVSKRARAMADAASLTPTGMSAVLGGDEDDVLRRLGETGLSAANFNGGGQLVVAGAPDALSSLAAEPPARSRVIPLQVAGAFHTPYMAPAQQELRGVASGITPNDPLLTLWTNSDGSVVETGVAFLDSIVDQVTSPVRWDLCMSSFTDHGVSGIIELAPAGTLTGLAKRALKGVPSVAISSPDDIARAVDLVTQNA